MLKPFDQSPGAQLRERLVLTELAIELDLEYAKLSLPASLLVAQSSKGGTKELVNTLGRIDAGLHGSLYVPQDVPMMDDLFTMFDLLDDSGYFTQRAKILEERRNAIDQTAPRGVVSTHE